MTFHGSTRVAEDIYNKANESPKTMTIPLGILAIGSIFSGIFLTEYFIGTKENDFWFNSLIISNNIHSHLPFLQIFIIKLAVALGVFSSAIIYFYRKDFSKLLVYYFKPLYLISLNKWYVDELYNYFFTKPYFYLATLCWNSGDKKIIDAYGPKGVAKLISIFSKRISLFQTGYLYHYAFVMLGGLVIILTWFVYY